MTAIKQRAPISQTLRAQLRADASDVKAVAARKAVTMSGWEQSEESNAAAVHFELGCWLNHYSLRVYTGTTRDRIDCVRRLFEAGIDHPGYMFFTVFDFGERQFDACFEMGDGSDVTEALLDLADKSPRSVLASCVRECGLKRRQAELS